MKLIVIIFKTYSYQLRKKTVSSFLLSKLNPYVDETIGDHYPISTEHFPYGKTCSRQVFEGN